MNIKWIQYLTKKRSIKKKKRLIKEQYRLVKYEIYSAIKAGDFYIYYYNYLSSEVVDKLLQKGFKVEKVNSYDEKWYISWED